MTEFEQQQMIRRKQDQIALMEGDFAPIRKLPISRRFASMPWFKSSGLENDCELFGVCAYEQRGLSGKSAAALKILLEEEAQGHFRDHPVLVAPTSGNFGYAGAFFTVSQSRLFDIPKFIAVVESTTSEGKQAHLRRSGATVVTAPKGTTAIDYAYEKYGDLPGHRIINQYTHPGNLHGQEWVAKLIHRTLGDRISAFAAAIGSTATVAGADEYLRPLVPHLKVVAVASQSEEERVPGSRTKKGAEVGAFNYEKRVDRIVADVTKREAFEDGDDFIGHAFSAGPTSGLVRAGAFHLLRDEYHAGRLDEWRNAEGKIVIVLLLMDMFLPYSQEYDKVLGVRQ